MNNVCIWGLIEDGRIVDRDYATQCGYEFIVQGGTPEEEGLKFCPFCGGLIKATDSPYLDLDAKELDDE